MPHKKAEINGDKQTGTHSRKSPKKFTRIPNPYNPYDIESGMLFYRKDAIGKIKRIFNSAAPYKLVVIQGYRGSGKTSTLRKMVDEPAILGERFIPVYLKLSEIEHLDLEHFLLFMNHSINHTMGNSILEKNDMFVSDLTSEGIRQLIDAVEAKSRENKILVFIFDDFERARRVPPTNKGITDILAFFRLLLSRKTIFRLILAGEGQLFDWLKSTELKDFLKIDAVINLEVLDDNVFESLIVEPVVGYAAYEPPAIQKIKEITGSNLYCQQLLCFYIIRHLNKIKKNVCSRADVQQALKNTINDRREDFTFFWENMPYERKISAAALTDEKVIKKEGAYFFIKESTLLNHIFDEAELKNILNKLIDDRYINKMQGRRFAGTPYKVPLFGEWVKKYHSFAQTIVDNWELIIRRLSLVNLSEFLKTVPADLSPIDEKTTETTISLSEAWFFLRKNLRNHRVNRENLEAILKIFCSKLDFKIVHKQGNNRSFFLIDTKSLNLSGFDETRLFFFCSDEPDSHETHHIQEEIQQYTSQSSFFSFLVCLRHTDLINELIRKEYLGIIILTEENIKKLALSSRPIQIFKEEILIPQVKPSRISKYQTHGPATITFYGRHGEMGKILGTEKKNFAIVGARKIGKTSLLKQVENKLPGDTIPVYMDLESPKNQNYHTFLQNLQDKLPDKNITSDVNDDIFKLKKFIIDFCRRSGKYIVFFLDEMDILLQYDYEQNFQLIKTFRALFQEGYCQFILSGFEQLSQAAEDIDSPLYNYCEFIHLGKLTENDALALISEPMEAVGIKYDNPGNRQLILNYTSCHPNLLQFFCRKLVERVEQHNSDRDMRTIYEEDIRLLYESFDYESYILYDFYLFTTRNVKPVERLIVLLLLDEYPGKEIFSIPDIDAKLKSCGINLETGKLTRFLRNLRLRYILEAVQGRQYRFALPAFPLILKRNGDLNISIKKEIEHAGQSL